MAPPLLPELLLNKIRLSLTNIKYVAAPARAVPSLEEKSHFPENSTGILSEYSAPVPTGLVELSE